MKKTILLLVLVCLVSFGCTFAITAMVKNCNNDSVSDQSSLQNSSSFQDQSSSSSTPDEEQNGEYTPSDTTLTFSDKNANKVITTATFDVSKHTDNAGSNIQPYKLFDSGMCLQRDAINRIWGTALNTKYIAVELEGKVYY